MLSNVWDRAHLRAEEQLEEQARTHTPPGDLEPPPLARCGRYRHCVNCPERPDCNLAQRPRKAWT